MAINLAKAQKVDLTKTNPGVTTWFVGAGWDVAATPGVEFDLDLQAVLKTADGKVRSDGDYVFYHNPSHESGCLSFGPDNRSGAGNDGGYDEVGTIDLTKVPANIASIDLILGIYDAENRNQTFGMVSNTTFGIHKGTDATSAEDLNAKVAAKAVTPEIKYDPSEDFSMATAVKVATIYRYGEEWKVQALGEPITSIKEALATYGLDVA